MSDTKKAWMSEATPVLETPLGTITITTYDSATGNEGYYDLYVELQRGEECMQVCVVTVHADEADQGILHIYPYNTGSEFDYDDAQDDLIVHTAGARWY